MSNINHLPAASLDLIQAEISRALSASGSLLMFTIWFPEEATPIPLRDSTNQWDGDHRPKLFGYPVSLTLPIPISSTEDYFIISQSRSSLMTCVPTFFAFSVLPEVLVGSA